MTILESLDALLKRASENELSLEELTSELTQFVSDAQESEAERIEYGIRKSNNVVIPIGKQSLKAHMGYAQFSKSSQHDVAMRRIAASEWEEIQDVESL